MPFTLKDPLPIQGMAHPPSGVPVGTSAMLVKLPPELLEALEASLANPQPATSNKLANGRAAGANRTQPTMQMVVGHANNLEFRVADKVWKVTGIAENVTQEIYARHSSPQPPHTHTSQTSSSEVLQLVSRVTGRFSVSRELDSRIQDTIRQRTQQAEQDRGTTVILDSSGDLLSKAKTARPKIPLPRPAPSTVTSLKPSASNPTQRPLQATKSIAALTPPKSDGSPSSQTSRNGRPKHNIPAEFSSLDLTLPQTWIDATISLPLRVIHCMAPTPNRPLAEIVTEVCQIPRFKSSADEVSRVVSIVAKRDAEDKWVLRDESMYYVRPWLFAYQSSKLIVDACRQARSALKRLGYEPNDDEMDWFRRPESRDMSSLLPAKPVVQAQQAQPYVPPNIDMEAIKREAALNPAPTLTGAVRQGFFTSAAKPTKKTSKGKEPKEPKPKASGSSRAAADKVDVVDKAKSRVGKNSEGLAGRGGTSSSATTGASTPSHAKSSSISSNQNASTSIADSLPLIPNAPVVHTKARPLPGSATGRQHAQKRLSEEATQRAASSTPGPRADGPSRSASAAGTPAGEKRKPSEEGKVVKKRKADVFDDLTPVVTTSKPRKDENSAISKARSSQVGGKRISSPVSTSTAEPAPKTKKRKAVDEAPAPAPPAKMRKSEAGTPVKTGTALSSKVTPPSKTSSPSAQVKGSIKKGSAPNNPSSLRQSVMYTDSEEEDSKPLAARAKVTKASATSGSSSAKAKVAANIKHEPSPPPQRAKAEDSTSKAKSPLRQGNGSPASRSSVNERGIRVDVIKQEAAKVISVTPSGFNPEEQASRALKMVVKDNLEGWTTKFQAIAAVDEALLALIKMEMTKLVSVGVGGDRSMLIGPNWLRQLRTLRKSLAEAAAKLRVKIEAAGPKTGRPAGSKPPNSDSSQQNAVPSGNGTSRPVKKP